MCCESLLIRRCHAESANPAELVRVAIVDDHPIVLDGLEYLFRKESGFTVVARCETAEEAVTAVLRTAPDILLLDVHMPEKNGIWVLEQIAGQSATQVILLTAGADEREIAIALKLGARGVVLKQRTNADLITCIRDVQAGKRWIDEEVLQKVVHTITDTAHVPDAEIPVTKRELEVIQLVARGLRNKLIAERLSVSDATIKTHLRTIFRKFALSNRTELAIWARQNGFDEGVATSNGVDQILPFERLSAAVDDHKFLPSGMMEDDDTRTISNHVFLSMRQGNLPIKEGHACDVSPQSSL